jgi:SOS-response transcriptional repressor LexA
MRNDVDKKSTAPDAADRRMQGLPPHALAILAYLQRHAETSDLPPTRAEIRAGAGIGSTATVQRWLLRLQQRGLVRVTPHVARGIRLTHGPGRN